MTEKSFTRILFIAAALALLALITLPASAADPATCTKSYNVVLKLTPAGAEELAVQLVYGYSPLPAATTGDLTAKVAARDERTLTEFHLRDPRNQFGDSIEIDNKSRATPIKGLSVREDTAVLAIMFRQEPDAASFALYDSKGILLKSVDLTKAEDRTSWNCTPDYGIVHRNRQGLPLLPVLGVIVVLAIAAGAGWFFLKRRSGKQGV